MDYEVPAFIKKKSDGTLKRHFQVPNHSNNYSDRFPFLSNNYKPERSNGSRFKRQFEQTYSKLSDEYSEKSVHQVPFLNTNLDDKEPFTPDNLNMSFNADKKVYTPKQEYHLPQQSKELKMKKDAKMKITHRDISKRLVKELDSYLLFDNN